MYNKKAISVKENHRNLVLYHCNRMIENHVKKYFNPLKPDSARVVYQILPDQYADPDTTPKPIKMTVEIKDSAGTTVCGERDLTYEEKKNGVLFWDGKDNGGQVVDPEAGPFEGHIALTYRETGRTVPGIVTLFFLSIPVPIEIVQIDPSDFDPELPEGQEYRETEIEFKTSPKDLQIEKYKLLVKNKDDHLFFKKEFTPEFVREEKDGFVWKTKWNGKNTTGEINASAEGNPYKVLISIRIVDDGLVVADEYVRIVVPISLGAVGTIKKEIADEKDWYKVYLPDKYGGKLEAKLLEPEPGVVEIYKKNMVAKVDNPYITQRNDQNNLQEHGWYYIKVSNPDDEYKIKTILKQHGQSSDTPWSGYWWPINQGELATPLEKYDNYVDLFDENPHVKEWYLEYQYDPNAPNWDGLCDAYSNAAIKEPEPTFNSTHGGILFTVGDKKGLLTEMWSVYMSDNFGTDKDIHDEVHAGLFHRIIQEFIWNNKLAVGMDLDNTEIFFSHPVWRFETVEITAPGSSDDKKFWLYFNTEIKYIEYAEPEYIGTPIEISQFYEYWIRYNENGNPIETVWWKNNNPYPEQQPDYIWSPLFPETVVGRNLVIEIVRFLCEL